MSQDQPPKSNQSPDEDLDDIWDSPPTNAPSSPQSSPRQQPTPRSAPSTPQLNELIDKVRSGWSSQVQPKLSRLLEQLRPTLDTALTRLYPLLEKLQAWWRKTLPKIRRVLPESVNRNLSDRVLTNVAIALLVLVLWNLPGVFLGKPARVSQAPTVQPSPQAQPSPSPEIPVAVAPSPSPVSSPPPSLDLPPEQHLIAAIQDQVAEVTNRYSAGLIQSVQANFRSSRLIVTVGDGWYGLPPNQQDSLATEMQQRAKELNFNKLEINDADATLLARSPVVGETMIILHRS